MLGSGTRSRNPADGRSAVLLRHAVLRDHPSAKRSFAGDADADEPAIGAGQANEPKVLALAGLTQLAHRGAVRPPPGPPCLAEIVEHFGRNLTEDPYVVHPSRYRLTIFGWDRGCGSGSVRDLLRERCPQIA